MCLYVNVAKTKAWMKKNRGKKNIRVYKLLELMPERDENDYPKVVDYGYVYCQDRLKAPYRNFEYKPGVFVSKSRIKKQCLKAGRDINPGIHTYKNRKTALEHLEGAEESYRLVELRVDAKDFIAAGRCDLVFRQAKLTKKGFQNALTASWKNLEAKRKKCRK